jgi:hypothetical protein
VDRYRELLVALAAVLGITVAYAGLLASTGVPEAGGFVGHGLGITGFALMLLTETGYSFRKRAMRRPRGTMRSWLRFHIFTGIVGPYLVVLHAAWSFDGLAGAVAALTLIVVASGFIGRYIYTSVPRTANGVELEARELAALLEAARREVATTAGPMDARAPQDLRHEHQARTRLRELERQMAALRWARRALATWHAIHVPIGMVLFSLAFLHIGAAIFYATLGR